MKLFVSSSSIKSKNICDCVKLLNSIGVSNIELSGGTNYDSLDVEELIKFKVNNSLNYLVHNYFPPVPKPFVLNLHRLKHGRDLLSDIYFCNSQFFHLLLQFHLKVISFLYTLHSY